MANPEGERLAEADGEGVPWRDWGPYLAERAWATVREDYSADGNAWDYFPHDHARSRTYRWSEDGLAGVCDRGQTWCLGLAFWNGQDPILKERVFGLTGPEGNHGEDAKELWWYLDSTPTHSWMRWRYVYPQLGFPYEDLRAENGRRNKSEPEYELADTGVLADDRYWLVTADFAKAAPHDLCLRVTVENRGPEEATADILPVLWFRNTWVWDSPPGARPVIRAADGGLIAEHESLGRLTLAASGAPEPLCCDNETNGARLFGVQQSTPFPKDGISDHVVTGAATVNPEGLGTKAALRYRLTVPAGAAAEIRLRLRDGGGQLDLGEEFGQVLRSRQAEAASFYADLADRPAAADDAPAPDDQATLRAAAATLLWSKQFYHYDVTRWLDGDPGLPPPPKERNMYRNAGWRHLSAADVLSFPRPGSIRGCRPRTSHFRLWGSRGGPALRKSSSCCSPGRATPTPRPAARVRMGLRRVRPAVASPCRAARLRDRRQPGSCVLVGSSRAHPQLPVVGGRARDGPVRYRPRESHRGGPFVAAYRSDNVDSRQPLLRRGADVGGPLLLRAAARSSHPAAIPGLPKCRGS